MRLLLVEDDVRLARGYQRNLERAEYQVDVFHDAESAWEFLQREARNIQIIILDVLLPGQSGVELCRQIRRANIETPILLLTALDQTGDKVAGLDAGADDYLTKPFPVAELLGPPARAHPPPPARGAGRHDRIARWRPRDRPAPA